MIVAIIPAYNEEDTIGTVVLRTKPYVDKVIVVDDGSKDKTAETAQLAGAEVVQHITNGGKGAALKTGFEYAEKLHVDVVVCLDADAQHNPDDIPKIIAPILSGEAEMVIASRYENKDGVKDIPIYRRFGLWVLNKATNFGSECNVMDTQCGFRAYSGEVLGKFGFKKKGFSVESEMLEDAIENNIKIKEVPFVPKYDVLNSSTEKPVKHGLGVLNSILKIIKDRHPLLFFGASGLILLILGLTFGILSFEYYFSNGFIPFGPSIAAAVFILMGAFCIFAGLILSSISGMIQGLTKLNRSQERKLLEDTNEEKIQLQTSLSLPRQNILYGGINGQKIQGVTVLNLPRYDILYGGISGQNILSSVLNHNQGENLPKEINGLKIPEPTSLNHNHKEDVLGEINGHIKSQSCRKCTCSD
jgi:glycosyltransferase involved in cell wall biosynthesis